MEQGSMTLSFSPLESASINAVIRRMHGEGRQIREIAEAVGLDYEATRGRGRRMGLKWKGAEPRPTTPIGEYYNHTDSVRETLQRAADARLLASLAMAFQRGDHLPAMQRAA